MTILIAYTTTEGQTRKICRFCADTLIDAGFSVEVLQISQGDAPDPARYAGSILAASVHLGRYQKEMEHFAAEHGAELAQRPSLFLAVSLAAVGDDVDDRADLDQIAQNFCDKTGYHPDRIEQIAGAFRFSEYDFFKSWAMRYVARIKGRDVSPDQDTEYTDWDNLRALVLDWSAPLQ